MSVKANLEIHLIQNFAVNGLNAGESGLPKRVEFGGESRRYISSQSQKYAMKEMIEQMVGNKAQPGRQSYRTRQLYDLLFNRIVSEHGKDRLEAEVAVGAFIEGVGFKLNEHQTQYLLFLARGEIENLIEACITNWDILLSDSGQRKKGQVDRSLVTADGDPLRIASLLDGGQAIQVALNGRMVADFPEIDIRSSTQVAHAIATGRSVMELDFYSGVDDFLIESGVSAGAVGMMGYTGLMSSCMYRYMNIDVRQLYHNLLDDRKLTEQALRVAVEACVRGNLSGRVNSTAPFNMPSLVMIVLRTDHPWNLANAFVPSVSSGRPHGVIGNSIVALDDYWGKMARMYGDEDVAQIWVLTTEDKSLLPNLENCLIGSLSDIVTKSVQHTYALALP